MLGFWKEVVMVQDRNPMKTYNVTVETLMADGRIFHRAVYPIKARDGEEAAAIVHNDLTLRMEPNFRISKVEEVKGNAD